MVGRLEQHVDILLRGSAVSGKRNFPRGQIFLRGNVIQAALAGEKNLSRKGDALHDITPLEMYKCYLEIFNKFKMLKQTNSNKRFINA